MSLTYEKVVKINNDRLAQLPRTVITSQLEAACIAQAEAVFIDPENAAWELDKFDWIVKIDLGLFDDPNSAEVSAYIQRIGRAIAHLDDAFENSKPKLGARCVTNFNTIQLGHIKFIENCVRLLSNPTRLQLEIRIPMQKDWWNS
tara:strand:- start:85968 stop:86402 length:435 start_codon:yes stop_codon:yes gene_type:complete